MFCECVLCGILCFYIMDSHTQKPFGNLIFNFFIPSLILFKLSSDAYLGPVKGLILALAFPLGFGAYTLFKERHFSFFSAMGVLSILVTGGIGLLELNPQWIAVKEALIPFVIGSVLLGSEFTKMPLTTKFLEQIINVEKLESLLDTDEKKVVYVKQVKQMSLGVAMSFYVSSLLNYLLAKLLVVSAPGTTAFNEELGRMTALSLPVIAIPSTLVLAASLLIFFRRLHRVTGADFESLLKR